METQDPHGLASGTQGLSIVVPVYNEESCITNTAAALLQGLPASAELVFVCNGCTDRSFHILKAVAGARAVVLELASPSKTAAINLAEQQLTQFPRFYVDSDILIEGRAIVALAETLRRERLEMISPRAEADLSGASRAARAVYRIGQSLPHGVHGAFHGVVGVSEDGRSRWGEMPDVMADDSFMEAQIPPLLKAVDQSVMQLLIPPRTLWSAIRVRERWTIGQRELASRGIQVVKVPGQRRALLRLLFSMSHFRAAWLYVGVRVCADLLATTRGNRKRRWYHDPTARRPSRPHKR